MNKKESFYQNWKNKTSLEKSAIKSLNSALKIIFQQVSKKEIFAIYVMGSFVRREMNNKSDVDIMVVVKNSKYNKKIERINLDFGEKFNPEINLCVYSIWELKTGRRCKSILKKGKPHPIKLAPLLPGYKLIYGKQIPLKILKKRCPKEDVEGMIDSFEEVLFPWYRKNIIDFDFLVKQIFWIVYDEQRARGKNPPYEWKNLKEFIKEKNHIVHEAYDFRIHPTKNKKIQKSFIKKIKNYLKGLEKEFDI
jgi:predicted nucleotidyltransferase